MLQELDLDAIPGKKEIVQNDEEISMMLDGATVIQILWSMLPPPDVPDGRSSLLIVHYPKQWRDKKSAVLTEFLQVHAGFVHQFHLCLLLCLPTLADSTV